MPARGPKTGLARRLSPDPSSRASETYMMFARSSPGTSSAPSTGQRRMSLQGGGQGGAEGGRPGQGMSRASTKAGSAIPLIAAARGERGPAASARHSRRIDQRGARQVVTSPRGDVNTTPRASLHTRPGGGPAGRAARLCSSPSPSTPCQPGARHTGAARRHPPLPAWRVPSPPVQLAVSMAQREHRRQLIGIHHAVAVAVCLPEEGLCLLGIQLRAHGLQCSRVGGPGERPHALQRWRSRRAHALQGRWAGWGSSAAAGAGADAAAQAALLALGSGMRSAA